MPPKGRVLNQEEFEKLCKEVQSIREGLESIRQRLEEIGNTLRGENPGKPRKTSYTIRISSNRGAVYRVNPLEYEILKSLKPKDRWKKLQELRSEVG